MKDVTSRRRTEVLETGRANSWCETEVAISRGLHNYVSVGKSVASPAVDAIVCLSDVLTDLVGTVRLDGARRELGARELVR